MRRWAITLTLVVGFVLSFISVPAQDETERSFLLQVQKDSVNYFWEQVNPDNGLVKDSSDAYSPCSVSAVGFGLVALCLMEKNGWKSRQDVQVRLIRTLKTLRDKVEHTHGFFYHFVSMNNGQRIWKSEASSMDTALVIAGALFAGEYFKNTQVDALAQEIYQRVQWDWMLDGRNVLSMGYKPETGFLPYTWDSYNEGILLYALAIGSPTHPVPKDCWWAWKRPVTASMAGPMVYCRTGSLFVYQYPHAFLDFRYLNDGTVNYWKNSVKATLANRYFCIQNKARFKTYDDDVWGVTACLGPDGYKGYGAEPADEPLHDGTVSPAAVAGSLPFTPKLAIASLRTMYQRYGQRVYGRYGFYDAFNVDQDWWSGTYLGISQGVTAMMIENLQTRTIWAYFMKHPSVKKWAKACMKNPKERKRPVQPAATHASNPRNRIPTVLALADWK